MKVFVTGGTGYIGRELIRQLLQHDNEVTALIRNGNPRFHQKGLTWKTCSLSDPDGLSGIMKGCSQLYHVAALAKMWHPWPEEFFEVNVTGTRNAIEAAQRAGIRKMVYTSTAGVMSGSINTPITEDDPILEPFDDDYPATKFMAERIVAQAAQPGFETVIVNPPRVFGGIDNGVNAINNLIRSYLKRNFYIVPGDGSYQGNYAFIDDVVKGHMGAMAMGKSGERYIVGGENHSYESFYELVGVVTGKKNKPISVSRRLISWVASASERWTQLTGREPAITTAMANKIFSNRQLSCAKAIRDLNYSITPLASGLDKTLQILNDNG